MPEATAPHLRVSKAHPNPDVIPEPVPTALEWLRTRAVALGVSLPENLDSLNEAQAMQWLEQRAQDGDAKCQNYLGCLHCDGTALGTHNYCKAAGWFLKAALQDHAQSCNSMGFLLWYGYGFPCKDRKRALYWTNRAARLGSIQAQYNSGLKDKKRANVSWMRLAAEQGHYPALLEEGNVYFYGEGVQADPSRGFEMALRAARKGVASAQCFVGISFLEGHHVSRNLEAACFWLREAARQNDIGATEPLGRARKLQKARKEALQITSSRASSSAC